MVVTGKTSTGFEFEIETDKAKDVRYARILRRMNGSEIEAVGGLDDLVVHFMGEEGLERIEKHIEGYSDGHFGIEAYASEMKEVLEIITAKDKDVKN